MKTSYLKIICFFVTCFVAENIFAYDFGAINEDGVTIYYKIISEEYKTCEVTYEYSSESYYYGTSYHSSYSGVINIPSSVLRNSNLYTVIKIGDNAFNGCYDVTSITIPISVKSIGYQAFACGITSIEIPSSVTNIGYQAFYKSRLRSIIVPSSVTEIGYQAFFCDNITYLNYNACVALNSSDFNFSYDLKEVIIGDEVPCINNNVFSGCSNLTSLTIGKSVSRIGDSAFSGCSGLVSLEIPNSVTHIGANAFSNCKGLQYLTIPSSVEYIGNNAFSGCSNIEYVNYDAKVELSRDIIPPINNIKDVVIGCNVPSIASYTFENCQGLTSIKIPNSIISIGEYAFSGCSGLISVTIPNSVTIIENGAFSGCSNLNSIIIGNSVSTIGSNAFYGCSSLNSIIIGASVSSIGGNAFYGNTNLERVDINDLESWFKISFDDECANPLYYGHYLNLNNQELHDIVIPNTITTINPFVLYNATCLTSIEIPNSVTSIGEKAFYGCSNLTSVKSNITNVFKTGTSAFEGCDKATLYVPEGLLISYSGREDWSRIAKIEESESGIKIAMSCNSRGKVVINDETIFTKKLGKVKVLEDVDNTFEFVPNPNCKLEQVLVNGFDVTASVENNKLIAPIDEGASMIVTFSKDEADVNHDGRVDISDVVSLVNLILGN